MDFNISSDSGVTPYFSNVSGFSPPAIIRSADSLGLNPPKGLTILLDKDKPEEASFYIANKIDEHVKSKNVVGLGFKKIIRNVFSLRDRFLQSKLSIGECVSGLYFVPLEGKNYHLGTYMVSTNICRGENTKGGAEHFIIPNPDTKFSLKYLPASDRTQRPSGGLSAAGLKPVMM